MRWGALRVWFCGHCCRRSYIGLVGCGHAARHGDGREASGLDGCDIVWHLWWWWDAVS